MRDRAVIDITGQRFHYLTVLGFSHFGELPPKRNKGRATYWFVRCDCGNEKILSKSDFMYPSSHNISCGCIRDIKSAERCRLRNLVDNPCPRGDTHHMRQPNARIQPRDPKTGKFTKAR